MIFSSECIRQPRSSSQYRYREMSTDMEYDIRQNSVKQITLHLEYNISKAVEKLLLIL